MSEPVAYLATNPTYPSNADALVWEPKDWHITWEFKPLYLHPDPRVAELEAVLRECRDALDACEWVSPGSCWFVDADKVESAIAKIDEVLK